MAEPRLTRGDFLRLGILAAAPAPLTGALQACARREAERVVNFFNWSSFIAKDTLPAFTRETGIKVNYDMFANEEEMFAKLVSGAMGYDLVVATDYLLPRLLASHLIAPIPMADLRNLRNLDRAFLHTPFDPKQEYSLPYLWGTTGIGFNRKAFPKPPSSWQELWDEKHRGRIAMLDNARDCISTALLLKGHPEESPDERHLEEAKELLLRQKPLVKQYTSSTYIDGLITGEFALAMAYSGDVLQAMRENPQLDYAVPREGSFMWVECLCLLRAARHRDDTVRLVDYLLRPEVAADIANFVRYATPNAKARPLLQPALLKDPRVFPPANISRRLRFHASLDPELDARWQELWSDIKTL